MDMSSHGCVSLSDAATWFGIEFDESTGHAHSALADARVTAKLLKLCMEKKDVRGSTGTIHYDAGQIRFEAGER